MQYFQTPVQCQLPPSTMTSRAARPLRPIIQVTSPLFPIAWPPLSGHCPQSPPRQLRRHHRSPLRQPSKVGLTAAPIFSLAYLYTAAQTACTDSPMQPGSPDPVYDYACSSTAVSAAAVAAATCWPNNQYAPIIHKPVLQIYGPHIGYCSPVTSKGATHWLCYAFLP